MKMVVFRRCCGYSQDFVDVVNSVCIAGYVPVPGITKSMKFISDSLGSQLFNDTIHHGEAKALL